MERKHKHNAKPCYQDGLFFASQLERKFYSRLKLLQQNGEIKYFLCQVPFFLIEKKKYVCDFLIFWTDGEVQYVDSKGMVTPLFELKKSLVEEKYPVKIHVFKKWEDLCKYKMMYRQNLKLQNGEINESV